MWFDMEINCHELSGSLHSSSCVHEISRKVSNLSRVWLGLGLSKLRGMVGLVARDEKCISKGIPRRASRSTLDSLNLVTLPNLRLKRFKEREIGSRVRI